jgi:hypothetical protein
MTSAFPIAADCSGRIFGMQLEWIKNNFNRQDAKSAKVSGYNEPLTVSIM